PFPYAGMPHAREPGWFAFDTDALSRLAAGLPQAAAALALVACLAPTGCTARTNSSRRSSTHRLRRSACRRSCRADGSPRPRACPSLRRRHARPERDLGFRAALHAHCRQSVLLGRAMTSSDLPPYDPDRILSAPFPERIRLVCRTWASQVNPTPKSVMVLYWAKYLFVYIGGWAIFQTFDANYPGFTSPPPWAFTGTAFQTAVGWSGFYALPGICCGWGAGGFEAVVGGRPPLPAHRQDQAVAVPAPAAIRRHPAQLVRRGALRREPALPAARARRARDHAGAALAERRVDSADGNRRQ